MIGRGFWMSLGPRLRRSRRLWRPCKSGRGHWKNSFRIKGRCKIRWNSGKNRWTNKQRHIRQSLTELRVKSLTRQMNWGRRCSCRSDRLEWRIPYPKKTSFRVRRSSLLYRTLNWLLNWTTSRARLSISFSRTTRWPTLSPISRKI